jgi:putative transcriptional regulator
MKNSIKIERAKKDFTQADLAERVGVSRQTINSIEKGRFIPSTLLSLKIACVFQEKIDNIFTLEEEDWGSEKEIFF